MDTFKKVKGYRCIKCDAEYDFDDLHYTCEKCNGNLQIIYDYQYIKRGFKKSDLSRNTDYSIWRYSSLMPLKALERKPNVHIGWTPLYRADRLAEKLGSKNLYIKDDGRNPSASSKDRASAVVVVNALERDEEIITGASTGNAASSLACLTAPLGVRSVLFVPATAPRAKITQLLVYGAKVIAVQGSYDDAFDLCLAATRRYGWYNRNTGFNPYTREGKKTVSYEICEQLGWECPDKVFVSVGDGNLISGVWKGFVDLYQIGLIDRLPQLVGCQAEKSDAVKRAFDSDGVIRPVEGTTIADSISVRLPRDGDAAVKALRESKGFALSVTDDRIIEMIPILARQAGVFGEPAGVTPLAVLEKAITNNLIGEDEHIVVLVSGNGLKDIDAAMRSTGKPLQISPDVEELERIATNGLV